jgi:hypothetical protein
VICDEFEVGRKTAETDALELLDTLSGEDLVISVDV